MVVVYYLSTGAIGDALITLAYAKNDVRQRKEEHGEKVIPIFMTSPGLKGDEANYLIPITSGYAGGLWEDHDGILPRYFIPPRFESLSAKTIKDAVVRHFKREYKMDVENEYEKLEIEHQLISSFISPLVFFNKSELSPKESLASLVQMEEIDCGLEPDEPYVVFHPATTRWKTMYKREEHGMHEDCPGILNEIRRETQMRVVLSGSAGDWDAWCDKFTSSLPPWCINMMGKTSLPQAFYIFHNAEYVLAAETFATIASSMSRVKSTMIWTEPDIKQSTTNFEKLFEFKGGFFRILNGILRDRSWYLTHSSTLSTAPEVVSTLLRKETQTLLKTMEEDPPPKEPVWE